ncbi:MAG: DNA polymerase III subunit beta [Bacteroidetes bacterium RIFOXYA12_FULL_35_11]|nr:MAG: DNA polymerase III subunit beta [Bacteroidetes bacterium GWF2_35_48]OFY75809.1 MAG: DNA polymerase III subunit beta [Bacteroidetes bacterium RIFOXYA12_FULL_35_11]OFY94236.1 MAG: DNA polymerase III subunit beta [Bacteroidetes bacterium RIFOXYB2_FULL_35_7]OFY98871.1 MAG: DNA polymerase III subunit beta [Bacteroidetes bacterium RIFOXYC12_FULL_35_7]HBX53397.1 DNA polymerase III subunit beta [Bacteroidales bacterium]
MNFVVSSSNLLGHLQAVSKVISSKNTLPILDNFHFLITGNNLVITTSDLESTLTTNIELIQSDGNIDIAIEAKRLLDILKEFPEQPLSFSINEETKSIEITTSNGKYSVVGQDGADFPKIPEIKTDKAISFSLSTEALLSGITKSVFATAEDELRPVMNGIFIELSPENISFVATDAHKLVRYRRLDASCETTTSFILPKKPATLLKNILVRKEGDVNVQFDDKNAIFSFAAYTLICRLVEGSYPNYNSVIPSESPNRLTIDRVELYNTLRRVSVFANPASNLVRLNLAANQLTISAQDIDYAISAYERINCQYEGTEMEIGFKSVFLIDILSNISCTEVFFELSDPSRSGILLPAEKDEKEEILMLLMPMMINS